MSDRTATDQAFSSHDHVDRLRTHQLKHGPTSFSNETVVPSNNSLSPNYHRFFIPAFNDCPTDNHFPAQINIHRLNHSPTNCTFSLEFPFSYYVWHVRCPTSGDAATFFIQPPSQCSWRFSE